jgi:hypothetical protein
MSHDHIGHRSWQDSDLSIGRECQNLPSGRKKWDNENQEASLTGERNSRLSGFTDTEVMAADPLRGSRTVGHIFHYLIDRLFVFGYVTAARHFAALSTFKIVCGINAPATEDRYSFLLF